MTAGPRAPRFGHVPALDGLRGAAVAGVVAYHLGYLRGGFLGVDAFFVLSGFLITSLLVAERQGAGRIDLRAFWLRRARRLLPALAVVLVVVAGYAALVAAPTEGHRLAGDVAATAAYVANWHLVFGHVGYFDQFTSPSLLQHAWSLAVEEQFYLVWPLIVAGVLAWRRGRTAVLLVVAWAAAALSAVEMAVFYRPGFDTNRLYYGTDTRAASVLIGAALAIILTRWQPELGPRRRAAVSVAMVAAVGAVAVSWTVAGGADGWLYRGGFVGLEGCVGLVLVGLVIGAGGPLRAVFTWRPLRWLGLVSYGLYLWHWPVIVLMSPANIGWNGPALAAARIAVMLALTVASYRLVEQPIRAGRPRDERAMQRFAMALAGVGAASVVLAGVAVARPGPGTASLPRAGFVAPPRAASDTAPPAPPVSLIASSAAAPAAPAPPPPRQVLVLGDSTATALMLGAADGATGRYLVGGDTKVGCGLVSGRPYARDSIVGSGGCDGWFERWRHSIATIRPDLTVVMFGPWDVLDHVVDGTVVRYGTPTWRQVVSDGVGKALDAAASGGTPVAVLDVPCYGSPPSGGPDADVRDDPARAGALDGILADAASARPEVRILPVSAVLCPGGHFQDQLDGITLRPDGVHLTKASAELVWRTWLVPRLDSLLAGSTASPAR